MADRIAVIDHGKLREFGTHDELMAKPNGMYRHLQDLQNLNFVAKKSEREKAQGGGREEEFEEENKNCSADETETKLSKDEEKKYAERARFLAKGGGYCFLVESIGAVFAGLMFPAWGFVFAYMVEVLYPRVDGCDDSRSPPIAWYPEYKSCQDYWDDAASFMQDLSFKVVYGLLGVMASSMIGNIVMFYGFGTATERLNKRVRDSAFANLIRQEVAYFDVLSVGTITTQLSDDAALIHSFSGHPIRMFVLSRSSVMVRIAVAFAYVWPLARLAFGLFPFMTVGKALQVRAYIGDETKVNETGDPNNLPPNSAGDIMVESLLNIRTVASLTIEEERVEQFEAAMAREDPRPIQQNIFKGSTLGVSFLA